MTINTKLDEKLEGVDNFRAWKYRVMLILEENNLEGFIGEDTPEPKEYEDKTKSHLASVYHHDSTPSS